MEPDQEKRERAVALAEAVETAAANVFRPWVGQGCARSWIGTGMLFGATFKVTHPPARVEPFTVTFKPEAKMIKARGRVYSPIKTAWLATCIGTLVALGLVFRNIQAVWASAAMDAPQKGGFRLVSDYRAVNKQIKKVPGVMPNQEAEMYGPVQISNEVTVALMTRPIHLGSKASQEADGSHTTVLHFGVGPRPP